MLIRNITLVMIMIIVSSNTVSASEVTNNNIFNESANKLIELGIIKGYPDGSIKEQADITVIELIAIVTRIMKLDIKETEEYDYWGQPYIDKALEMGIIYEDLFDSYDRPITREEISYLLIKVFEISKDKELPVNQIILYMVNDIKDNNYKESVIKSIDINLLLLDKKNYFKPLNHTTRLEAIVIVDRLLNLLDNDLVLEDMTFEENELYSQSIKTFYINDKIEFEIKIRSNSDEDIVLTSDESPPFTIDIYDEKNEKVFVYPQGSLTVVEESVLQKNQSIKYSVVWHHNEENVQLDNGTYRVVVRLFNIMHENKYFIDIIDNKVVSIHK